MLEFYLCIIDSIANTQKPAFLSKFNNMVYADAKLSNDEKLFLFSEMQKTWNKVQNSPMTNTKDVIPAVLNVENSPVIHRPRGI